MKPYTPHSPYTPRSKESHIREPYTLSLDMTPDELEMASAEYESKRVEFLESQKEVANNTLGKKSIQTYTKEKDFFNEGKKTYNFEDEKARAVSIKNSGFERFYALRTAWSVIIAVWITALIIFIVTMTVLIGSKTLNYDNLKWFITSVTLEAFLQIVGMGYIAVRFLFSSQQKDDTP